MYTKVLKSGICFKVYQEKQKERKEKENSVVEANETVLKILFSILLGHVTLF